jgi:hypothetical protein
MRWIADTKLSLKDIAARVQLGGSGSANARLHRRRWDRTPTERWEMNEKRTILIPLKNPLFLTISGNA